MELESATERAFALFRHGGTNSAERGKQKTHKIGRI
jgi:hypothetical protein